MENEKFCVSLGPKVVSLFFPQKNPTLSLNVSQKSRTFDETNPGKIIVEVGMKRVTDGHQCFFLDPSLPPPPPPSTRPSLQRRRLEVKIKTYIGCFSLPFGSALM